MNVPQDTSGDPVSTITVLSVSPNENDHAALEQAFRESEVTLYPNCTLTLQRSSSIDAAFDALRGNRIPIVLFDGDWLPGAWREMAAGVKGLAAPPCLIVTSQAADDRLWAEALSHGAFDVISKPFSKTDVIRIVTAAWRRWRLRYAQTAAAAESQGSASET
jgi:FixJ family two-component response regulator